MVDDEPRVSWGSAASSEMRPKLDSAGSGSSSDREEIANAITHGIGLLVSVGAGAVLITLAALTRDPWQIVAGSIYVASLVALYGASTAYHAARDPRVKARLRVVDHCAIFGLIAGTYTPFTLAALRGGWGWTLFGLAWGLAVAGILYKLFLIGRYPRLSTVFYLGLGWMALIAIRPLYLALPGSAIAWMVAGGVLYSLGTPFYHSGRLAYGHAVWHLFVLAGSACHFIAVLVQLLPSLPA